MDRSDHRQAEILDACLTRLMSGSASVDDLLRAYPGDAAWLKPLLHSARQAQQAVSLPAMPPEAKLAGERRLQRQIRSRTPVAEVSRGKRLRLAFALASIALGIALLGSASGIAYAAESSLPGDNLYSIKQVIEQAQLTLSQTAEGEAELLVRFSEERLREAEQLSANGRPQDLPAALEGYRQAVERLVGLADQLPAEEGGESLQAIAGQLGRQAEVLSRIRAEAPQAAQPGLLQALQQSTRNRATFEKMLEVRGRETGPPSNPGRKATPAIPETPGAGQGQEKNPGQDQGRGRPPELPSD